MFIRPGTLQFTDYLKQLPSAWVIEHFFSDGAAQRKILSSAMIEELERDFMVPQELERRFSGLESDEQLRCSLMYLAGAMGVASEADGGLDDPIVASFLGYGARDEAGRLRVFGFESFEPLLRPLIVKTVIASATRSVDHTSNTHWNWGCCNDIAIIASLAASRILVKKRSGRVGVAVLQQIRKLVHTGEFNKNEDIESLLRIVCGYGSSEGFILEDEEGFRLVKDRFEEWLGHPIAELVESVCTWTRDNRCTWNMDLFEAICSEAGRDWLSSAVFSPCDEVTVREALGALKFVGMVDVRREGNDLLFRRSGGAVPTAQGQTGSHPVVIMPDFTVVIPQESLPETVYDFSRICRIDSFDRVYHGTIDKGYLTEALSSGMKPQRIVSLLEWWKAPANVVESVREWIREFERLSLPQESVLLAGDEDVRWQIEGFSKLSALLERVEAHAVFRIKPGCEQTVREMVRKMGFDERMAPIGNADSSEGASPEQEPVALFESTPTWSLVTEKESPETRKSAPVSGSKYGAQLKTLDLSETVQVIDYAILTGQRIVFTYEGSPYVRKGIYTVTPHLCSKGVEPLLDGELQRSASRKQFYVNKISSIGVVPQ